MAEFVNLILEYYNGDIDIVCSYLSYLYGELFV